MGGASALVPKALEKKPVSLAPSSHLTCESSTEGLAEPAWEAIDEVHDGNLNRLVKALHERLSGRGCSGWMGPVSSPLPQAVRAGSEPICLWNLDTQYSSVKSFGNWPSFPHSGY